MEPQMANKQNVKQSIEMSSSAKDSCGFNSVKNPIKYARCESDPCKVLLRSAHAFAQAIRKISTDRFPTILAIEPNCPTLKSQPALRRGAEERRELNPAERVSNRIRILWAFKLCVATCPVLADKRLVCDNLRGAVG